MTNEDIALLNAGLSHAGIRFSPEPVGPHSIPCQLRYINNSDGTMRWVFPASLRKPQFLRFYFEGSLRGKIFSRAYRILFATGAKKLITNSCTIYISPSDHEHMLAWQEWALFTGTTGPNRKLVLWHRDVKGQSHFTKLAVSHRATEQIAAERLAMSVQGLPKNMRIPQYELLSDGALKQEDLFEQQTTTPVKDITELPANSLQEWLCWDLTWQNAGDTTWYAEACRRIQKLERAADTRISPVLLQQLNSLLQHQKDNLVGTVTAHGDFTPWNIRTDGHKLVAIDWELSGKMPLLYDLFHFVYQQGILIDRVPFATIRKRMDTLLEMPEWIQFLQRNMIDAAIAEQAYLMQVVSYYLSVYQDQECWHTQIHWLLQTWCEAIGYWLTEEKLSTHRQSLLQGITQALHHESYAALKLKGKSLTDLPLTSDLDMCMSANTAAMLCNYVKNHSQVRHVQVVRKSFMMQIVALLHDHSTLHLDCIWRFQRKSLVYMNAADLYNGSTHNGAGVSEPCPANNARYAWLFHTLNGSNIPQAYYEKYFRDMPEDRLGLIKQWLKLPMADCHDFQRYSGPMRLHTINTLKNAPGNEWHQRLKHMALYVSDTLRSILQNKGCIVTFSGVDGAGKSTVIEATRQRIEKELRKPVVVIRHRPSILPIISAWKHGKAVAEQMAANTLPHQGDNNSRLSSILRFGYYYADYLLGQFYVHARYVWRGYVVLYDRYYFDFINDSKRSNIKLSSGFASWWYRFLLKPEFNFFLYAPADVILARKQEMQRPAIEQMTNKYLGLFERLSRKSNKVKYIPVCNLHLDETLSTVFNHIQSQGA